QEKQRAGSIEWVGKETITFSDAMRAVRRWIWQDWILNTPAKGASFKNLPRNIRETLLSAMAAAA
ncbi:MAG: hypothetical protein HYY18_19935, partial [Planctomycetes bacterium]|nr:hypothetical protein [Planctomycetota bacterium]